jgi:hypothetical protein
VTQSQEANQLDHDKRRCADGSLAMRRQQDKRTAEGMSKFLVGDELSALFSPHLPIPSWASRVESYLAPVAAGTLPVWSAGTAQRYFAHAMAPRQCFRATQLAHSARHHQHEKTHIGASTHQASSLGL